MNKYKKKPFLLLEVMIAIALVALCVIPLLAPHLFVLKYQREFVNKIELDHTVNLLYADTVERLYKNEIPWHMLTSEAEIDIDQVVLDRIGIKELPYKGRYQFKNIRNKPNPAESFSVYLYELIFTFEKKNEMSFSYPYVVTIVRDLTSGQQQQEDGVSNENQ